MGLLKNEYKSFLDDIEKNIKDKEDLEYIRKRFMDFIGVMTEQIEEMSDYKKEKIEELEENQKSVEERLTKVQEALDNIKKDIYAEDGFDFEITCPYCNYDFFIDVDEENSEVECPECKNTIELDWGGNIDDEFNAPGCSGNCGGCHGCGYSDDDDM